MKYFLHDTNAFQDEKITQLFIQYGYEGVGLFYTILEKLAMQEKPVKTVVLKRQLSVGKKLEKVWSYLEEIKLISSNNGETFSIWLEKNYQTERLSYHSPKEWNALRLAVFIRDNHKCIYCGQVGGLLEVDHLHPFSKGGSDDIENLATACVRCNRQKQDKSFEEYLKHIGKL